MSTTSLFVELIVIGVGAAMWVTLLTLTLFGYQWIPADKALSLPAAIPILAIVYVLGIVSDRVIDILFNRHWGSKLRSQQFPNLHDYHEARRKVLMCSAAMSEMIEYSRSRLRICRGWAVHSLLIACTLVAFAWTRIPDRRLAWAVSIYGSAVFCSLAVSSWYAWHHLNTTQYLKLREQAAFLDRHAGKRG